MSYSKLKELAWSVFKRSVMASGLYLLGYFEMSTAWIIMPVLFMVWRDRWQKKREKRLTLGLLKSNPAMQKNLVKMLTVDDLPSWVHFPDYERAEWFNRIIKRLWPSVNLYAEDLIRDSIEPMLKDMVKDSMKMNFKFEKIILGDVPLRVGGVKVYEANVSRKQIILDMEIIYNSDCVFQVSLSNLKAGIKNLSIHGMMRIVMSPLVKQIPLVGGIQAYFLNNPKIDFLLTNAAEVVEIPGLGDMIRKMVVSSVSSICVLPNKYCLTLVEGVPMSHLKMVNPIGVLRVHIIQAKDLVKKDVGIGAKSDPYCVITVGAQVIKTEVIERTLNPKWNFMCEVVCEDLSQFVDIRVIDEDRTSPLNEDDYLGSCSLDISSIAERGFTELWVNLENVKSGKLNVSCQWLNVSCNPAELNQVMEYNKPLADKVKGPGASSGLLTVFVDSANNLPKFTKTGEPSPKAVLTCGGLKKETGSQYKTCDPVWEESFNFFIKNIYQQDLSIEVVDEKTDSKLGEVFVNIKKLLMEPNMEQQLVPYILLGSQSQCKVIVSTRLRLLKPGNISERESQTAVSVHDKDESPEPENVEQVQDTRGKGGQDTPSNISSESGRSKVEEQILLPPTPVLIEDTPSVTSESNGKPYIEPPSNGGVESVPPPRVASPAETSPTLRRRQMPELYGKVQLTIRYSNARSSLVVIVHRASNLPMEDEYEEPDPYIKLYLLPDRKESSKKKTRSYKDERNPVYDETFEFDVTPNEIHHRTLEVSVCSKKKAFQIISKTPVLGVMYIPMMKMDLSQATTEWYLFEDPSTSIN